MNPLALDHDEAVREIRRQRGLPEYEDTLSTGDRAEAVLWWLGAFRKAVETGDRREQARLLNWSGFAERLQAQVCTDLEER